MSPSLREIAEWMDPEKPARRMLGNGPPFASDRPETFDLNDLDFDFATVTPDQPPPRTRTVSGPVKLQAIENKATYNGIRYFDGPPGSASGVTELNGGSTHSSQDSYEQSLFFANQNAYDLGMINRSADNSTLPEGYTDKGIIESHRWIDPEDREERNGDDSETWRSLRNVINRHRDGVRHRVLWQNLLKVKGPVRNKDQAELWGKLFGAAGFEIMGLCEIYNNSLLNDLQQKYDNYFPETEDRWAKPDLGVLLSQKRNGEDRYTRDIRETDRNQFNNSGPGLSSANKEGWLRVTIEVLALPGNPKFDLYVTHLQSVHVNSSKDKMQGAKIQQMRDLCDEIRHRNEKCPERPKIVMGDFNIHSRATPGEFDDSDGIEPGEYLSNFMHQMHTEGMQEAWLTFGGPGPNNKDCPESSRERLSNNLDTSDGYQCNPFKPEGGGYYRGNRLDYVFVEKPRPCHNMNIDISRMKMIGWPGLSEKEAREMVDQPGTTVKNRLPDIISNNIPDGVTDLANNLDDAYLSEKGREKIVNALSADYLSDHVGIAFDILTSPMP